MAPPGNRVISHRKPGNFTSRGHHGTPGWYIGPSLDHFICMQCYIPTTDIVRITDSLKYIPKAFVFPKTTAEDYLQHATGDIILIIKDPTKTINFLSYGDATKNVMNQIAHILQRSTDQHSLKILPLPPMLPHTQNQNIPPQKIASTPASSLRVEPFVQPPRVQEIPSSPTSTPRL